MLSKRITGDTVSPRELDLGLLILRVGAGLAVFIKHGLEKLTGYSTMVQHFPDPIHIGAHASLAYALLTDGICSLLVVLGLFTRPASALILINLTTAFIFIHHANFLHDGHTELVVSYMVAFAAIMLSGPGHVSFDSRIGR
jgi:putative oxidoreductase